MYTKSRFSLYLITTAFSLLFCACEKKEVTPDWVADAQEPQVEVNSDLDQSSSESSEKTKVIKPSGDNPKITFMYYNLRNYLTMRRGDTERPKPENEITALIQNIAKVSPDILAVCEIGVEKDLADFSDRLKKAGVDLPHTYLTMGSDPTRRQAMLSKFPIHPNKVPKYSYKMKGRSFQVKRGILDATVDTPNGKFRFLGAHLKSKRPSKEFDHNLVRRNEALILRKHISTLLNQEPYKLLVYGDMNDTKNSPALRTIKGPYRGKLSIRPIDLEAEDGTRWTQHWTYEDIYSRIDFAMVSEHMAPHVDHKHSFILEVPKDDPASDHRALIISIK